MAALVILLTGPAGLAQQTTRLVAWSVIKSQHRRISTGAPVQRVAVGDQAIASVEVVTDRELLLLGRDTGRTTLIVWFRNGTMLEGVVSVQRDLSVLQAALRRVHASIEAESAPDRDAIVLTGRVPDVAVSLQAEAVARSYLAAGQTRGASARPVLTAPRPGVTPGTTQPGAAGPGDGGATDPASAARLQEVIAPSGEVINLIQLERLPGLPEDRILEAARAIGGDRVTIRRVLAGNVRDDERDTLVLAGQVPNQIALVRVLELAAQIFTRNQSNADDIEVVADESGGLVQGGQNGGQGQQGQGGSGGLGIGGGAGIFGGSGSGRNSRLGNQLQRNLGRATVISAARGRILSFIEVADLPQIRVNIRVFEVNRERLRSYTPVTAALASTLQLPSPDPSSASTAAQGRGTTGASSAVQNVLGFLAGGFINEMQFTSSHVAITQALALLERKGLARTLSSPSLTVLSGESAQFQVGGEVPIPVAFTPAIGGPTGGTPGLFTAVDFVSFGLQLQVRPLVGDDDTITLDVQPQVVTPDAALTASIRDTTGNNQTTTAFASRALRTSARLPDGQSLLIGGLSTQSATSNTAKTPGLGDAPGLGWLFRSFNRSEDALDLVVVVNPVILRSRVPHAPLWAFPSTTETLQQIAAPPRHPGTAAASTSPAGANPR